MGGGAGDDDGAGVRTFVETGFGGEVEATRLAVGVVAGLAVLGEQGADLGFEEVRVRDLGEEGGGGEDEDWNSHANTPLATSPATSVRRKSRPA